MCFAAAAEQNNVLSTDVQEKQDTAVADRPMVSSCSPGAHASSLIEQSFQADELFASIQWEVRADIFLAIDADK
jgi:hypothetical protein